MCDRKISSVIHQNGKEKKEFYSSAISVYTMVSIVGFMILSAVVLR